MQKNGFGVNKVQIFTKIGMQVVYVVGQVLAQLKTGNDVTEPEFRTKPGNFQNYRIFTKIGMEVAHDEAKFMAQLKTGNDVTEPEFRTKTGNSKKSSDLHQNWYVGSS